MSTWWTYSLSDLLLFSSETYHRLFELYNKAIWPTPLLFLAIGILIPVLVFWKPAWQGPFISAVLAVSWGWVAWAYHLQHYATINWAAPGFAMGFVGQALLFLWSGIIRGRLVYRPAIAVIDWIGFGVFGLALVIQPLLAPLLGRAWIQAEIFGVAPDPTAIATLGLLLLTGRRVYWTLLILPAVWCLISGAILAAMASPLALIPPIAAVVVISAALWKSRRASAAWGR